RSTPSSNSASAASRGISSRSSFVTIASMRAMSSSKAMALLRSGHRALGGGADRPLLEHEIESRPRREIGGARDRMMRREVARHGVSAFEGGERTERVEAAARGGDAGAAALEIALRGGAERALRVHRALAHLSRAAQERVAQERGAMRE